MKERRPPIEFWLSYSDLATGLMMVFLVVMLLLVLQEARERRAEMRRRIQERQSVEARHARIREIVGSIGLMVDNKVKLAETINALFPDGDLEADPATAQVDMAGDKLVFAYGSAELEPAGARFLRSVIPRYVCALWLRESGCDRDPAGCRGRVEPDRPGRVRHILVRGHASLIGVYEDNHRLSAMRAERVTQEASAILAGLARWGPRVVGVPSEVWSALPAACREHAASMYRYARERFWAVAAGDTEHCAALFEESGRWCDDLPRAAKHDPDYQKVTLGLELTGDDLTGLALHVLAIHQEIGGDWRFIPAMRRAVQHVMEACWRGFERYHGCEDALRVCLAQDGGDGSSEAGWLAEACSTFGQALVAAQRDGGEAYAELLQRARLVCAEEGGAARLPGCRVLR